MKLTETQDKIEEADRQTLRDTGFSDRDIWDIATVASFFDMPNRIAPATDMKPNAIYRHMARTAPESKWARLLVASDMTRTISP